MVKEVQERISVSIRGRMFKLVYDTEPSGFSACQRCALMGEICKGTRDTNLLCLCATIVQEPETYFEEVKVMKYWSCYIPTDCISDVKRAVLERVQELGKLIFESSKPGHENESQFWDKYVALRDVYLCLEGADKNEEFVSLTTFKPKDDSNIIMHREAKFDFPRQDEEEV